MIVRAILNRPELIDNFDYFNDYTDTIGYLKRVNTHESKEILNKLEAGYQKYLTQQRRLKPF